MKTFSQLREKAKEPSSIVFSNKIDGVPVKISKEGSTAFVVYIDGDKFDTFRSQSTGEKMAKRMIKQLKVER